MEYIKLMFLSMVPIVELRGAIPLGIAMDLNPIYLYLACLVGSSIVAIPIVLVFRQVIDYLRDKKYFNKVIYWIDRKIEGRSKKLKAASIIGIIIFVGIPIPTTGSWSAAALASILKMRIKDALIGIFLGNAIAGVIMSVLSLHLVENMNIFTGILVIFLLCILSITKVCHSKKRKKVKIETLEIE